MLPTGELPEDMIVDIILRLPVKSLVRFRCVCKSWYSWLTSSDFSTKHLEHSRRQFYLLKVDESFEPPLRIGLDRILTYKFALAPEYDLDQLVHIDHPRMGDRQIEYLQVIGSIDGLVCISLNFDTYIMMWNPATRQSYLLPSFGVRERTVAIGLGRYQNNGYKVVRIVSRKAEVYDSYSNLWHKTADPPNLSFTTDGCTIANGVPYWLSYCHSVIWFDPIHDMFGTMKLPVGLFELNSDDEIVARLGLIRGAVAVLLMKLDEYEDDNMVISDMVNLDVWMMDQPHGDKPISWTKQFRVKSEAVPGVHWWVTCWKDGELVFETADNHDDIDEGREMYLYDHFRDETKRVPGVPVLGCRLRGPDEIFLYKESLISPHPSNLNCIPLAAAHRSG